MTTFLLGLVTLAVGQDAPKLSIQPNGVLRHPSTVQAIAVTPDSRTAFVGLNDGALLAYALETRKPIATGFRVYSAVSGLALNSRGDRLVVTDLGGSVTMLDTTSFKTVTSVRLKADPEGVVFAPDDGALFVKTSAGRLLKLRASDLSTEKDIMPTANSRVIGLALDRDGRTVATSDRDGQIKLWSADLEHVKTWKAHDVFARSLAFHPLGMFLISGGDDAALKVWKLSDFTLHRESKEYHQESVECIAFAPRPGKTALEPGGARMITGGYDGLCQFWDGKTFDGEKSYPNYRGYITACAVSRDGRWLVRGGSALDFVPLDRPDEFERVADYGGAIMGAAVSADMKTMVTGGLDRRVILWTIDKGIVSKSTLLEDWVTAVDFCRDGRSVAAALANGKIEIRDAGTLERDTSWPAHKGRITGIAQLAGGLVSVGDDGAVHLWDTSGAKRKSVDEKAPCRAVAVRGNRFAVGTANGTVSVYDASSAALVKHLRGRPLSVTALAFSTGGTRLMVGYFDGGLESFDVESWTVAQFRPGTGESVLSIDANPKSDRLAVGFRDGHARILDVVSLREAASVLTRPAREIFAVRWVLDENGFAAAGASNAIAFYRIQPFKSDGVVLNVQDRLMQGDNRDKVRKDSFSKVYNVKLERGRSYVIDLTSTDLDPYLRLENSAGRQLAEDDDGGGELNSRLVFTPQESGTFRVVVTTYVGKTTGNFHLRVTQR